MSRTWRITFLLPSTAWVHSCAGARVRQVPHGIIVALVRVRGRRINVSVSTTTYLLHPPCGAWFTAALSDARVVALVRVCGKYHMGS